MPSSRTFQNAMDDEEITPTFPRYKTISFMWPILPKCSYTLHITQALLSTGYNHFGVDIFGHDSKGEMFLPLLLVRVFNAWEAHCWLVMCPF